MTLSVYAIASGRRAPQVAGARLRVITSGNVSAIVADVRRPPRPTTSALRRYHRVVAAIASQAPAVLPARFGTTADEDELRAVLQLRRTALGIALRLVRGRVQMTIRLIEPRRRVRYPARARQGRSGRSGRDYLKSRALATGTADVPAFQPVRDALQGWVRAQRVERMQRVITIYHLVPRRAAGRYLTAARSAIAASGLRAVISGPFPPYAFSS